MTTDISSAQANRNDEITFYDIVSFLSKSWKKLVAAILVGTLLGLVFGFVIGTYSAEYVFFNKSQNALETPIPRGLKNSADEDAIPDLIGGLLKQSNSINSLKSNSTSLSGLQVNQRINKNAYSLDLASWKAVQKSLPNLATQMMAKGMVPEGQKELYEDLAKESWWRKNVVPNFLAISKNDTKDLAGTVKDLEPDNFILMSLTITESGRTPESALKNAQGAADFLRFGGAFIQVRNLLNSLDSEVIGSRAEIQKQLTSTNIEISYLAKRLKQLDDLRQRFPTTGTPSQLIIEPKESSAKYLPLPMQIIATQNEINSSKEIIERLNQRLTQLALVERFLVDAKASANQTFNGLNLIENLLAIEAKLRASIPTSDAVSIEILDQLRSQLLQIQARFAGGLEPTPSIKSTGLVKAILAGSIPSFFLALFWLMGRESWLNAKRHSPEKL